MICIWIDECECCSEDCCFYPKEEELILCSREDYVEEYNDYLRRFYEE